MTVDELARLLATYPPDLRVVVNGYEDGYDDLSPEQLSLVELALNTGRHQWEGKARGPERSDRKCLRDLDQSTAALFRILCSACISLRPAENVFLDARAPSLGGNAGANALQKYGLGFDNLNVLNEHGLIIADYNSYYDYRMSVRILLPGPSPTYLGIPFSFQRRRWVLEPTTQRPDNRELMVAGVALTRSGQELSRIVELQPIEAYVQDLTEFFRKQGLRMVESSIQEPHSFNSGC